MSHTLLTFYTFIGHETRGGVENEVQEIAARAYVLPLFLSFKLILLIFQALRQGICHVLVFPHNEPMWSLCFLFSSLVSTPRSPHLHTVRFSRRLSFVLYPNNSFM